MSHEFIFIPYERTWAEIWRARNNRAALRRFAECDSSARATLFRRDGRRKLTLVASYSDGELHAPGGRLICRLCFEPYADGGDGFDGMCPNCADKHDREE